MALTVMFKNQLLVAIKRGGIATVTLDGNKTVKIEAVARIIRRSKSVQDRSRKNTTSEVCFVVTFGELPRLAQQWYKKQVNIAHKRIVERTPDKEAIRGRGLIPTRSINGQVVRVHTPIRYREVPTPKKPEITDDTIVSIATSTQYNGHPAFKTGKDFVVRIENKDVDFAHRTYVVGKITGFTIITPASR